MEEMKQLREEFGSAEGAMQFLKDQRKYITPLKKFYQKSATTKQTPSPPKQTSKSGFNSPSIRLRTTTMRSQSCVNEDNNIETKTLASVDQSMIEDAQEYSNIKGKSSLGLNVS